MQWPVDLLAVVWDKVREDIRPHLKARMWAEVHDELSVNIPNHLTCLVHVWVAEKTFIRTHIAPVQDRNINGLGELMEGIGVHRHMLARNWLFEQGLCAVDAIPEVGEVAIDAFLDALGLDESSTSACVIRHRFSQMSHGAAWQRYVDGVASRFVA